MVVAAALMGMQGTMTKKLDCLTAEQQEILSHLSIVYLDDGFGNLVNKTIRVDGANFQVVNGTGTTDGPVNGTGNIIVGYNELLNPFADDRTGSHNIVGGSWNSYSTWGGLVAGRGNTISAQYASVAGGYNNQATGALSSISGGGAGVTSADGAWVGGGISNTASGFAAAVSGGASNLASGNWSSIAGGVNNEANNSYATISGGGWNVASGIWATVTGGAYNEASAHDATVSGGRSRTALGDSDWVAGTLFEDD